MATVLCEVNAIYELVFVSLAVAGSERRASGMLLFAASRFLCFDR